MDNKNKKEINRRFISHTKNKTHVLKKCGTLQMLCPFA